MRLTFYYAPITIISVMSYVDLNCSQAVLPEVSGTGKAAENEEKNATRARWPPVKIVSNGRPPFMRATRHQDRESGTSRP